MMGHALVAIVFLVLIIVLTGGILVQRFRCPDCGRVAAGTDHLC